MTSSDDRKNNGQVDPRKVGTNGLGPAAARPGPSMGVEGRAAQAEASVQGGAGGEDRSPRGAGREAARRTEQLVILSVAIVLGGVGFAFHPLWIPAVVVMALLWGYMASEMRSRGGGVVSDVVGTVVSEAKEVGKAASAEVSAPDQDRASGPLSSSSANGAMLHKDSQGQGREAVGADRQAPPLGASDDQEPTRRELYAQAQDAEIRGRSGMNQEELKEALES
jgi:hypothetical protein